MKTAAKVEWKGFEPRAYGLSERVLNLPVNETTLYLGESSVTRNEKVPRRIGEVITKLSEKKILSTDCGVSLEVKTDSGDVEIDGPAMVLALMDVMIELQGQGMNPFLARWYWYSREYCLKDPQESFSFFLVYRDKIVKEEVSLPQYYSSGFDPTLLVAWDDEDDPTWSHQAGLLEASNRLWYRKFYTETLAGQLMLLRDDGARIYHFTVDRSDVQRESLSKLMEILRGMRQTQWVIVSILLAIFVLLLFRH